MKSHRTDGVSLTFGLFFLVLAAWYLLARLSGWSCRRWAGPWPAA